MRRQVGLLLCGVPRHSVEWVADRAPWLHMLAAAHLCDREAWTRAWAAERGLEAAVVCVCGEPCWERLAAAVSTLDPFAVHRVDAEAWRDAPGFEALIWGKICRALTGSTTPREGLRRRPVLTGAPLGRREILGFPRRHEVVPVPIFDRSACRASRCGRCVTACPVEALSVTGGALVLDRARCEGCGYCATTCPTTALRLPGAALAEVLAELRGALAVAGGPRVVIFDCAAAARDVSAPAQRMRLPCVGMLSLPWLLAPLAEGAAGVLVLDVKERCRPWHRPGRARAIVSLAQLVLSGFGGLAERVAAIGSVPEAAAEVQRLASLPDLGPMRPPARGEQAPGLREILARLTELTGGERRPLRDEALPFGTARVDRVRCSLCGVCAATCPPGALSFTEDAREARLTFDESRCDGCRACQAQCPEGALTIVRELPAQGFREDTPLHRGRMMRCRRCRAPLGTANLVRAVRSRLGDHAPTTALLEHCPTCRLLAAPGVGR